MCPWRPEADDQGLALMRAGGYPLAFPAFTWEVRANDRNYHMQFKKKFAFCLTKKKYAVSQPGPVLGHFFTQPLIPELVVVGGDMTEMLQSDLQ